MLVGLNRYGLVHDFYYPYVGLENHDTARALRHRIGVWVDNKLSWLDDKTWVTQMTYRPGALISVLTANQPELGIRLEFADTVDSDHDVFMRRVKVFNLRETPLEVCVMFHQIFRISNSLSGDTAQYLPAEAAILHYKGARNFVVKARLDTGEPFDQYSVGLAGIEGKEGTFKDAEDGELSGNPVEHGSVDSVVRCRMTIPAEGYRSIDYYVGAGLTREGAIHQTHLVSNKTFEARFSATEAYWRNWLRPSQEIAAKLPDKQAERFRISLMLIKAHIDRRGAVIASSDTQMLNYARDAYAYCWPRDAVNAIWPLVRMGYREEAANFFEFCRLGLQQDGFLMHKYQPDGSVGSSWHPYVHEGEASLPIQEDETAAVVMLMREYYRASNDLVLLQQYYETLVKPMANFMASYVEGGTGLPHATYDLWEERFATSTYTTAITKGALLAAAEIADALDRHQDAVGWQMAADDMQAAAHKIIFNQETNYFYREILSIAGGVQKDPVIGISSAHGAWLYGLYEATDPKIKKAYETLATTFNLDAADFPGLPRYVNDLYNSTDPDNIGNPWFVTSLWLAQYYAQIGKLAEADKIVAWTEAHMLPSGVLFEQVDAEGMGVSVAPLVWSQGEYVMTILDLYAARHVRHGKQRLRQITWGPKRNS